MLAILCIASYHDLRSRQIPDYLWVAGGGIGAILYVFDWSEVDFFVVFAVAVGCVIAFLVWKIFPMGDADALAILAISVAYPVSFGIVMNPVAVFFGGLILEHFAAFFYNLRYNVEDLIRHRQLFGNVECSVLVKIMAFYSTHKKRAHERFTFCAERVKDDKRIISLKTPSPESDYEERTGVFVTWAMPAFPFMLAAFVIAIMVSIMLV